MPDNPTRRRAILTGASVVLLGSQGIAQARKSFPPVPLWRPSFQPSLDTVVDRIRYYSDNNSDFAVFQNGTCAVVENGLSDQEMTEAAHVTLANVYNFHPDFNPYEMDDGNILVSYNHPAYNVVFTELARQNREEIEARYLDGLATDEAIMTPSGLNHFDDIGKMALLGRCYMFMDAQAPVVVRIERGSG